MILNTMCNTCDEPSKYPVGFWDGAEGKTGGCLYDCKNEKCEVNIS